MIWAIAGIVVYLGIGLWFANLFAMPSALDRWMARLGWLPILIAAGVCNVWGAWSRRFY